jgi:hypothetical protein
VTALTLLTCKFYQFRSLHNLRSLVSGSSYQAQSPAMSSGLTCFCGFAAPDHILFEQWRVSVDQEKKCDSSNYG